MTSNLGSRLILDHGDGAPEELEKKVMDVVKGHFRPEFLNRVDDMVIFNHLRAGDIESIADIQFERLRKRLAEREIDVVLGKAARKLLAARGYDPVYGARPLKRAIQRYVLDPLAELLIAGEVRKGQTVDIGVSGEKLSFTPRDA